MAFDVLYGIDMRTAPVSLAFDALSDAVRRQILAILSEHGELTVSEIAEQITSVGRTTVSSHLRVLRTSEVIQERKVGRHRFVRLDADGSVREALDFLQRIMTQAADELSASSAISERVVDAEGDLAVG